MSEMGINLHTEMYTNTKILILFNFFQFNFYLFFKALTWLQISHMYHRLLQCSAVTWATSPSTTTQVGITSDLRWHIV